MSTSSLDHSTTAGVPPVVTGNHVQLAPGAVAKIRNPILVVVFTIITLGIYQVFWWYFTNRELADYGRARGTKELGDNPTMSALALFPGALIIVPAIWTMVTTFQRIQAAQRLKGQTPINGWLGLVIALVISPVLIGYMQSGLNSAWQAVESAGEQAAGAG
jgi:UDP-N-acetylmuramyl pentapeptide phosphotransferase/UDP-N-acetylglucosamine-1-phosphate transferase